MIHLRDTRKFFPTRNCGQSAEVNSTNLAAVPRRQYLRRCLLLCDIHDIDSVILAMTKWCATASQLSTMPSAVTDAVNPVGGGSVGAEGTCTLIGKTSPRPCSFRASTAYVTPNRISQCAPKWQFVEIVDSDFGSELLLFEGFSFRRSGGVRLHGRCLSHRSAALR